MPPLRCLLFQNYPIFKQLQLEEYLFRASERDYLLLNQGSCDAIVLGRTNQVEQLVDQDAAFDKKIPIIRRYSAGGTVLVDSGTLFMSLILSKKTLLDHFPHFFEDKEVYPNQLAQWHFELIQPIFQGHPIALNEQDLCLASKKIAGQAQALARKRVVHHSTFLMHYDLEKMQLLKLPKKQPKYRHQRSHEAFICSLEKEIGLSASSMIEKTLLEFGHHFQIDRLDCNQEKNRLYFEEKISQSPHRRETLLLTGD